MTYRSDGPGVHYHYILSIVCICNNTCHYDKLFTYLHEQNLLKQASVQNVLYEKLWSLDPLYGKKLTYFIQHFSNDKEKF